jgi:hypothetical protein
VSLSAIEQQLGHTGRAQVGSQSEGYFNQDVALALRL